MVLKHGRNMIEPIITSILDTDLYKISMSRYVLEQYPLAEVEYEFICRNKDVKLGFLKDMVLEQIGYLKNLTLTYSELEYLKTIRFLSEEYLSFLDNYRFDPDRQITVGEKDGQLTISVRGKWIDTILYEVPLLAIVNELYFGETTSFLDVRLAGEKRLMDKIELINQYPTFCFTDFGTRRRYSKDWQKYVVETLKQFCPQLVGTSNVKLAMDVGLKAIGTFAHEIPMCHLALVDDIRQAQKRAFYTWMETYGADNGIALSDTFTTKAFFIDFDYTLATNYSGIRQDSGNPIEFGRRAINHYRKLGIDPRTKTIIFSDGLTVPRAIEIYKEFVGRVGVSFGIGTSLQNDMGVKPLNIVIKVIKCNGKNVVKLSDDIGKAIGDSNVIEKLKKIYDL